MQMAIHGLVQIEPGENWSAESDNWEEKKMSA